MDKRVASIDRNPPVRQYRIVPMCTVLLRSSLSPTTYSIFIHSLPCTKQISSLVNRGPSKKKYSHDLIIMTFAIKVTSEECFPDTLNNNLLQCVYLCNLPSLRLVLIFCIPFREDDKRGGMSESVGLPKDRPSLSLPLQRLSVVWREGENLI